MGYKHLNENACWKKDSPSQRLNQKGYDHREYKDPRYPQIFLSVQKRSEIVAEPIENDTKIELILIKEKTSILFLVDYIDK